MNDEFYNGDGHGSGDGTGDKHTMNIEELTKGTQIAYVPNHAGGDLGHPDVEFGFVSSVRGDTVFCRYWSKYHDDLRTMANSEGADRRNIVRHESRPQADVQAAIKRYGI